MKIHENLMEETMKNVLEEYGLSEDMSLKDCVEKQIPKKVVNIQGNPTWGYCPYCNKTIDKSGSPNGCKHCLQRVDWGNKDAE